MTEQRIKELRLCSGVHGPTMAWEAWKALPELLDEIDRLTAQLAAVQAERDAAVRDMWLMRSCQSCKHKPADYPSIHGACADCDDEDKWEWRGVLADTTMSGAEGEKHA